MEKIYKRESYLNKINYWGTIRKWHKWERYHLYRIR